VHRSVISKVVAILRRLEVAGAQTVTEVAQATDLPLSTAHRIIGELAAWQVLHRGDDARYEVALTAGGRECAHSPLGLLQAAAPTIADLGSVTSRDVRFGYLDEARVWYAEKPAGPLPLSAFSPAATLPAHATAIGQVLLAFSPAAVVRQVINHGLTRYTPSTTTSAVALDRALTAIRLRGIAVVSGQLSPDFAAVAAPVFGSDREVVAALEVRLRDLPGELRTVVPALTVAARGLSRELGHADPASDDETAGSGATVLSLDLRRVAPCVPGSSSHRTRSAQTRP
jgi:DNA-binding IclR family transcriptional regulator